MSITPKSHQDHFTAADVMNATGISAEKLRAMVSRQPAVILLPDDVREQAIQGAPIRYSANRIAQIALTLEIVKLGLTPRNAALMAVAFTDFSSDGAVAAGNLADANSWDLPEGARYPGKLYAEGMTVLIGDKAGEVGRVVNVRSAAEALHYLKEGPAIIVHVDPIYHRVRAALGLPVERGNK